MNILKTANEIINHRKQEAERQYGDIGEEMEKVAGIYNLLHSKNLSARDIFEIMAILKLCRESVSHKEDNLLDCVAYLGAMNNYIEKPTEDCCDCVSDLHETEDVDEYEGDIDMKIGFF